MSDDDFDLASLAEYLHLNLAQVSRMAERGHVPGRRVGGQWRFSRAEIHHWLEGRIGALDEQELAHLEGSLTRAAPPHEPAVVIESLLPLEAIAVPLEARTRGAVISAMVELAAHTGWLWDAARMADAVRSREDLFPTALENGVALLHPRRPLPSILAQPFLALGRTTQGIPFGAQHGGLTDLFFLICSVDEAGHLRTLARLSRLISDAAFLGALRDAESAREIRDLIVARERRILS